MTRARFMRRRERGPLTRAACAAVVAATLTSFVPVARAQSALPPPPPVSTGQILTPEVSDPLLTPPPGAPRHLGSWDDALALIKAQSPDYITAAQSVVRAEAEKRITLAAVLPMLDAQASFTHQFYTTAFSILTPSPNGMPAAVGFVSPPSNLRTFAGNFSWAVVDPRGIYGWERRARTSRSRSSRFPTSAARSRCRSCIRCSRRWPRHASPSSIASACASALERLALTQARLQFGQGTELDVDRGAAGRRGIARRAHHRRRRVAPAGARGARRGARFAASPIAAARRPRPRRVRGGRRAHVPPQRRHRAAARRRRGTRARRDRRARRPRRRAACSRRP